MTMGTISGTSDAVTGFMHNVQPLDHVFEGGSAFVRHRGYGSQSPDPLINARGGKRSSLKSAPGPASDSGFREKVLAMIPTSVKECFSDGPTTGRSLFYLVCFTYSMVLVVQLIMSYKKFETVVDLTVARPSYLKDALPGVTLCNKNQVRLEAVRRKIEGLEAKYVAWRDKEYPTATDRKVALFDLLKTQMAGYHSKYPLKDHMKDGPDLDIFIKYLKCNDKAWAGKGQSNKEAYDCDLIRRIRTAQGKGVCVTLFHEAAKATTSRQPQLPLSLSFYNRLLHDFVPREMAKIVLDFDPDNYTDVALTPGAEIMFHDTRSIPLEASLSFTLRPGKYYQFFLKKTSTFSLVPPYTTLCSNYSSNLSKYTGTQINEFLIYPLSEMQCEENCYIKNVTQTQQCWPKSIPYWENNPFDDKAYKWCENAFEQKSPKEKRELVMMRTAAKLSCQRECPKDCRRDYFETFYQEIDWPSDEDIMIQENPETRKTLLQLRKTSSLVSIRYLTLWVDKHDIKPRLEELDVIITIGGNIGMFIGLCLINVYEYGIEIVVDYIYRKMYRK